MIKKSILLCGLPGSGKTTFLAALWYLLFNQEIPTALSLGHLPPTREYLNSLASKWCRFTEINRTTTDEVQEISLRLQNGEIEADLHVPDMSGETWGGLWASRSCAKHAAEWALGASGIMLFLHADNIRPPLDIMTHNAMIEASGGLPEDGDLTHWSPEHSPTQVVLVDVLQAIALPPIGNRNRRLAVIISAWDKVEDTGYTPDVYLKVHLPLLYQFLKCCELFSDVKIFGVSAQGGELQSPIDEKRLKDEDVPSMRIKVVEEFDIKHDLTIPIKWLMT